MHRWCKQIRIIAALRKRLWCFFFSIKHPINLTSERMNGLLYMNDDTDDIKVSEHDLQEQNIVRPLRTCNGKHWCQKDIDSRSSGVSVQTEPRFPPEGTVARSQMGKREQERARQERAAVCASVCSSWGVPSQPSPPAVQHHAPLLTLTHNPQQGAFWAVSSCKDEESSHFWGFLRIHVTLIQSQYTWGWRRINVHHCQLCYSWVSVQKSVTGILVPETLSKMWGWSELL